MTILSIYLFFLIAVYYYSLHHYYYYYYYINYHILCTIHLMNPILKAKAH
jgi:hypothetical protein